MIDVLLLNDGISGHTEFYIHVPIGVKLIRPPKSEYPEDLKIYTKYSMQSNVEIYLLLISASNTQGPAPSYAEKPDQQPQLPISMDQLLGR